MDTVLRDILINTYNPNYQERIHAENLLQQFLYNSGALYSLLLFVQNHEIEKELRLAASICIKNKSRDYFRDDEVKIPITDEEKEACKQLFLEVILVETDNTIRGMLAESIRNVTEFEYPHRWPQLMPVLFTNLQTGDILRMFNSLTALRKIVKRYEFKHKEERIPLHEIIQHLFPLLQDLITHILENNSMEAAHVLRVCLKIFWSCTQYSLPPVNGVNVNLWFHALATILNKRLHEGSEGIEPLGQPESVEERNEWPWWKLKKWAARIVTHFIQRYGNPRYSGEENKAFSEHFRSHTAKLLLEPLLNILILKSQGVFVTENVHRMCITYICNSVEMSPTYKLLKPHMEFLLFGVIFPTLSLSQADISLFEEDPTEFIRKVHNVLEDWLDPRIAAINLLQMLARYRLKDTLPLFLPHLQKVMEDYRTSPEHLKNHSAKEACLVALAAIANILKEKKPYCNQIEGIFIAHVIPEFSSPVGFIRARVCWAIEHFSDVAWKKPQTGQLIVEGLLRGLRDSQLPVQAAAACSMRLFIDSDIAREIVRPILFEVVNEYFRIMSDIESDIVLAALQAIVLQFGEEIEGIAGMIIQQLLLTFESYSSAGEDDDEAAFGATECLETITTVLEVIKENQVAVGAVEGMLTPLVLKIFSSDDMLEYIENGIEIISYLTFYPENINSRIWEIFGPMISALDHWAYDYMMEMLTPIMHLISKDTNTFLQGSYQGVPFITMVVNVCNKVLEQEKLDDDREAKASASLLTCIVMCCRGHIDELIPPLIMLVLNKLPVIKRKGLIHRFLGIILAIILYNPEAACQLFQANSEAEQLIFQTLFERIPSIHSHTLRRLVIASFSALLSLPKEHFPPYFAMNLQPVMSMLVRVVATIDDEVDEDEDADDDDDDEEDDNDDEGDTSYGARNGAKVSKSTLKKLSAIHIPEEGYNEDEDCINVADEDYLETMAEAERAKKKYDQYGDDVEDNDDMDEINELDTPLDEEDITILFCNAMSQSFQRDPELFSNLQNGLDDEDKERLRVILETAEYRKNHPDSDGENGEEDDDEEDEEDEEEEV